MFHGGGGGPMGGGPGGPGGGRRLHGAQDIDEQDVLGKLYDSRVLRRMLPYLSPVKKWLVIGMLGALVQIAAQTATPRVVGMITDRFIQAGNLNGLNVAAIVLVGLALSLWGGQYLQTLFLSYAGQTVLLKLRTDMFDHLHRMSMSFFDYNKVGKLMSRVQNDINQLQEVLTMGIINIATNILLLIGIAAMMISMNAELALLTLSVVPILGIVVFIWQRFARRAFVRVRQAIAEVNDQLQESISGVRVVQSLSREEVNAEQFDEVNKAHLDANISAAKLQALMMPTSQVMTAAAYAIVIIYGGHQVLAGETSVGVLVSFLLFIQQFFMPVIELSMMYTEMQRAMASGVRIFELLDIKPAIQDKPDAVEMPRVRGNIVFRNMDFSYVEGVDVLHNINLEIKAGETVAFIGRTGAGKSSLMGLLSRFYEAREGEVLIDGYDVTSVTQDSLRRQIGIVPQDAFLFSGTIEDNIRYGKLDATRDDVIRAAQAAGVHEFITKMERGYETQVGERGHNLSAGQRQLICLARAILSDPPILVLDEATSNVDTTTERIMQASLRKLSTGRTLLIIAHRLSTITSADRIVALEHGNIVESGTHKELLAKKGLYANMYETLSRPE